MILLLIHLGQMYKFQSGISNSKTHWDTLTFHHITTMINEPRHDKTNIMGLRPERIQTSLRIRAVWSGSMLFAYKPYNKYRNW
jgi:hypothetical protein